VNVPETELPISALTEKDLQDIRWIAQRDFDYVALSFVQQAADVDALRRLLDQHGSQAQIIAKIEKPQALNHIDAIIETADAVMIARGDLGVEMDFPVVPIAQKTIAHKCQVVGKPCIIATEMLESMIDSPRPTRAEVSDVANAVFDHADAVMLSAESSIGKYPIEAVDAMHRVVVAAEAFLEQRRDAETVTLSEPSTTAALATAVRQVMHMQQIAAIALFTASGTTARLLAKNRPACPILALSSQLGVTRRACLYYGVVPRIVDLPESVEKFLNRSESMAKALHLATSGDRVIVLAGHPIGAAGGTKILIVEEIP
jgi:pyruvate kinase